MFTMLLGSVFIFFVSSMNIVSGADWCYQSQITCTHNCTGPDQWGTIFQQCNGKSQSPINILTRKMLSDVHLTPIEFIGYQNMFDGTLINNGHSVQLSLNSNSKIKGGKLTATYKAVQLHLHWGKDGGPGSEHKIDGEQFPMEMHIVHIKEQYGSLEDAGKDPTGVAVLGFFFQASTANKKYDPIINALINITEPSLNVTVPSVSLDMFILPQEDMHTYYRYDGSLTTPSCTEAVVWTLFEVPISLSSAQIKAFSKVGFSDGEMMVDNFRPVQPLNDRQVYYSEGHVVLLSSVVLITSALVSSAFTLDTSG